MGVRRTFRPTNLVANGDFSAGVGTWTGTGWGSAASVVPGSKTLTITENDTGFIPAAIYNTAIASVVGKRVYTRILGRVTNSVCQSLTVIVDGSTAGTNVTVGAQNTPAENQWYSLSGVVTQPGNVTGYVQIRIAHAYIDAPAADGKVAEAREVLAIDLSSLLPANLLALSDANLKIWCDTNIPVWFDGTLSGGRIGGLR